MVDSQFKNLGKYLMSSLIFSITDPISGVARTWFGFRYPDIDIKKDGDKLNCGNGVIHIVDNCEKCGSGQDGHLYCSGDCKWSNGKCVLIEDIQYYSFNVMHIDSQRKDHGLLTQLHGSFQPHGFWDFDFNEEFKNTKTNFYSRSRSNTGKRSSCFRVVP
jgi:hypothetical protein